MDNVASFSRLEADLDRNLDFELKLIEAVADFTARGTENVDDAVEYVKTNRLSINSVIANAGALIISKVLWSADRRFRFDDNGMPAAVIMALNEYGVPVDLIAWPTHRPDKFAPLQGTAPLLGGYQLEENDRHRTPIRVLKSPLRWLQQRCRAVVMINDEAALHIAGAFGPIIAEDIEHAAELRRLLKRQVEVAPQRTAAPVPELREAA